MDPSVNKGPIPLGRPSNCPRHFSEFENPCQVRFFYIIKFFAFIFVILNIIFLILNIMFQIFCCTAKIHQFEDPQPDHPPEKKSICKFYFILYHTYVYFLNIIAIYYLI